MKDWFLTVVKLLDMELGDQAGQDTQRLVGGVPLFLQRLYPGFPLHNYIKGHKKLIVQSII